MKSVDLGDGWSVSDRKARGAFFTPSQVARFMVDWAIRAPGETVLEPSCGDGAFVAAAAERCADLRDARPGGSAARVVAYDIHQGSIDVAREQVDSRGIDLDYRCGDFFDQAASAGFDAVVGNPPYVRYQDFTGTSRSKSLEAALAQGVRLSQLASSWAAFVVHASGFLKVGGRLALVLPAELLSVSYAADIRAFLLRRFSSVRLVLFKELVFPGVLEDVVLLLAEGDGGTDRFEVFQTRNAQSLVQDAPAWAGFSPRGAEKWTSALLEPSGLEVYERVIQNAAIEAVADWGRCYLGAVTGNNKYFCLRPSDAKRWGLDSSSLRRISPPGARHLRGIDFSVASWERLAVDDAPCYLFYPGEVPNQAAQRYIAHGEETGVSAAYKCRVRKPWWRVPLVAKPDLLVGYMSHETPRLLVNTASADLLNSLYGVQLDPVRREVGRALLPLSSLNSLTQLGAEIAGRAYGGGMLKHEPSDVAALPVISHEMLVRLSDRLEAARPLVGALLRKSSVRQATQLVDEVVLVDGVGMPNSDLGAIRSALASLRARRTGRSRKSDV